MKHFGLSAVLFTALSLGAAAQLIQVTPVEFPNDSGSVSSFSPAAGFRDYDNTHPVHYTGFDFSPYANQILADDVTRTTSSKIREIEFYYVDTDAPITTLYIYENTGDDVRNPHLIASYSLGRLPAGSYFVNVKLPAPLAAPSNLWVGFSFSTNSAALRIFHPPTIGSSDNLFQYDHDGNGLLDNGPFSFGSTPIANFGIATVVPEPTTLFAFVAGLTTLFLRRRRSSTTG